MERRDRDWSFLAEMYSAATNVNEARRARQAPRASFWKKVGKRTAKGRCPSSERTIQKEKPQNNLSRIKNTILHQILYGWRIMMCTAISYKNGDAYFGRNLDLERGYGERVVITPRRYPIPMRHTKKMESHYAMIGMATVADGFPLYYEATNEKGLSMAGLHFPGNAVYHAYDAGKENVAPFEFIPWVLGQCTCAGEAKERLSTVNLIKVDFSQQLPLSPLHWMISDRESSIVVESLKDRLAVYDNPFEVLTNNPPFAYHQINMSNYMGLGSGHAHTQFRRDLPLENYSLGMGALGLPGDFSSASRFVRAVFVKENSVAEQNEKSSVNQFFHILNSVAMPKGCVWTENGFEYTRYSSCCNTDRGIYYYTTYQNLNVRSVSMRDVDLEQSNLYEYGEICEE